MLFRSLEEVAKAAREARQAYNSINNKEQLALIGEQEIKLLATEKAIREAKARLGRPVELIEVKIATIPDRIRYVEGDKFDPTGMVVKAIFADDSEIVVTDYTLDKTTFALGDEKVVVSYVYGGKTYNVDLLVNVEAKPVTPTPDTPSEDNNNAAGSNKAAIIAVSVVVPVIVIAGVAVAVVLILKKKKAAAKAQDNKLDGSDDKQETADDKKETAEEKQENADEKEEN